MRAPPFSQLTGRMTKRGRLREQRGKRRWMPTAGLVPRSRLLDFPLASAPRGGSAGHGRRRGGGPQHDRRGDDAVEHQAFRWAATGASSICICPSHTRSLEPSPCPRLLAARTMLKGKTAGSGTHSSGVDQKLSATRPHLRQTARSTSTEGSPTAISEFTVRHAPGSVDRGLPVHPVPRRNMASAGRHPVHPRSCPASRRAGHSCAPAGQTG